MADTSITPTITADGVEKFAAAAIAPAPADVAARFEDALAARVEASRVQRAESVHSAQVGDKFWSSLGKKIRSGARIPDGYDQRRR